MKTLCNILWKLAGISPRMGNFIMDVLGDEKYVYVMKHHS